MSTAKLSSPTGIHAFEEPALAGLGAVIASPDGAIVYNYSRTRSELYVIKG